MNAVLHLVENGQGFAGANVLNMLLEGPERVTAESFVHIDHDRTIKREACPGVRGRFLRFWAESCVMAEFMARPA